MKKIMIALAIAATAVATNAASFAWSATKVVNGYDYGKEGYTVGYAANATAYLFATGFSGPTATVDAGVTLASITSLFATDLAGAKAKALDSIKVTSSGAISNTTGDFATIGNDTAQSLFLLIVSPDEKAGYIIAEAKPVTTDSLGGNTNVGFGNLQTATIGTAGKWQTVATPEPTSGLMLLLGVGLMALKRKRA